jgi:MFS family permease
MSFRANRLPGLGDLSFEAHASKDGVIAALVCSLGGTVFGYDLGALSAASQNLRSEFSLGPSAFGLTISCSLWGTVLGSMVAGYLAIYLGRRGLIASCALVYAIASATFAFVDTAEWGLVLALRFLCGVAIGGFTVGCPLYLAEIAPGEWRDCFVSLFQVQIGVGVVMGFTLGYIFANLVPVAIYWRACFGFGLILPLLFLLFPNQIPEEMTSFNCKDSNIKSHRAPVVQRQTGRYLTL